MDNNRTILAVVLVVLLWSGYSLFFAPQPQVQQATTVEEKKETSVNNEVVNSKPVVVTPKTDYIVNDNKEESFLTVSSSFFDIKLSTVGATIRSIVLKNYNETNEQDSKLFTLLNSDSFDLSTLQSFGTDGLYIPKNLNYKIVNNIKNIDINGKSAAVSFVASINDIIILKTYTFYPESYSFDINIKVTNNSSNNVGGRLNLSLITPWDKDSKSRL